MPRVSASKRPERSLAALFHGVGKPLELTELQVPEVLAGEALVRIECCTICGSDLHTISGARDEPVPSILGHEILGTIRQTGDPPPRDIDGDVLQVGDRVTWSTCIGCGQCDRCRKGMKQKCRHLAKYGHEVADGRCALSGGLAESILLRPGSTIVKVDPEIPPEAICPVNCATATIAAACRVAAPIHGQRVLILGAGMLGLTAAVMARTADAAQVTLCDLNLDRLRLAQQFGADCGVPWSDDRDELLRRMREASGPTTPAFDVVIEASGSAQAVEAACELGDVGSRIILVGSVMPSREIRLDPQRVVRNWVTIHGVHNYAPQDLRVAVEFVSRFHQQFPLAQLVSRSFSLSNVNEAIEVALRDRPLRVAIRPF